MKHNYLITIALASIVALFLPLSSSLAVPLPGSAQSFAVLGYAGVTNDHSDPNPQTAIWGNVGVGPGPSTSITGFPPGIVTGGVTLRDNLISNNNTLEDFDSGRSDFGSYGFSGFTDDSGNGGGGGNPVSVPPTVLLLGTGLVGLAVIRRRTK